MATKRKRSTRKRQAARERKYSVKADLSVFELAKAKCALTLEVFDSGEKVGTIDIGRGAIYWRGKNSKKARRIDWNRFAEIMEYY